MNELIGDLIGIILLVSVLYVAWIAMGFVVGFVAEFVNVLLGRGGDPDGQQKIAELQRQNQAPRNKRNRKTTDSGQSRTSNGSGAELDFDTDVSSLKEYDK
jgi:hypothetical protein